MNENTMKTYYNRGRYYKNAQKAPYLSIARCLDSRVRKTELRAMARGLGIKLPSADMSKADLCELIYHATAGFAGADIPRETPLSGNRRFVKGQAIVKELVKDQGYVVKVDLPGKRYRKITIQALTLEPRLERLIIRGDMDALHDYFVTHREYIETLPNFIRDIYENYLRDFVLGQTMIDDMVASQSYNGIHVTELGLSPALERLVLSQDRAALNHYYSAAENLYEIEHIPAFLKQYNRK